MEIIKNDKITWYDILNPTVKDIAFIKKQHGFHAVILDELLNPSTRSRVESYEAYLFMVYHLPMYNSKTKTSKKNEVDFLITHDSVITIRYDNLEPINNFTKNLRGNSELKSMMMENTGKIVYGLIEEIISFSLRQLNHIEENVSVLTEKLFDGDEAKMLKDISYAKRNILDYRIISRPQEITLQSLKEIGSVFWGDAFRVYLSDLVGDHLKVTQRLENYRESVESLESTNSQLLNAKSMSIMKKFTVLAFLTFPPVFVMAFFTVGVIDQAFSYNPLIFLGSFIFVILINFIMLAIFKKRGWL
ncbi:MAG: putative metal ion transporter YfjQ [Parcubacteria group bacterium Athens0714_26]|nr:MAG: putative metal ion transporter YfjQ [Parcubacteria group bacterium Athens1014_26]TSD03679.1 MAG: putative metal ion transporter YfjQ [Parcubacteria group bacterium Athens0714_26]